MGGHLQCSLRADHPLKCTQKRTTGCSCPNDVRLGCDVWVLRYGSALAASTLLKLFVLLKFSMNKLLWREIGTQYEYTGIFWFSKWNLQIWVIIQQTCVDRSCHCTRVFNVPLLGTLEVLLENSLRIWPNYHYFNTRPTRLPQLCPSIWRSCRSNHGSDSSHAVCSKYQGTYTLLVWPSAPWFSGFEAKGLKIDPSGLVISAPRKKVQTTGRKFGSIYFHTLPLRKDQWWLFFLLSCLDKYKKLINCGKRCRYAKDRLLSLKNCTFQNVEGPVQPSILLQNSGKWSS